MLVFYYDWIIKKEKSNSWKELQAAFVNVQKTVEDPMPDFTGVQRKSNTCHTIFKTT